MRFFVTMTERKPADAQERAAMCRHRISSIKYQQVLLRPDGPLAYGFRAEDGTVAILMYEVTSLEELDCLLKRDPGWAYCSTDVTPVVSTSALVQEAQDYLGEQILSKDEMEHLNPERRLIDPLCEYWLAYKEVMPFSPLLSQAEQDDVHRRTVYSQRAHLEAVEFADDNPVGRAVGILIAEGDLDGVKRHIEKCEVFPDTVVCYKSLVPLPGAVDATIQELQGLRRPSLAADTVTI
jgi:muconolactone delta-isomerase